MLLDDDDRSNWKCVKQLLHKSFAFTGFHLCPRCTLLPLLALTGSAQNGSLSAPLNILSLRTEKRKVGVRRDSLSTSLCSFSNLRNLRSRPFKTHTRPLTNSLPPLSQCSLLRGSSLSQG